MGFMSVYKHSMTNDDHFQFNKQVLYAVDKAGVDFLQVEEFRDKYADAINQEDGVLNKIVKSGFTDDIAEENTTRNEMIASCFEITKSNSRHPDEKVKKAAANLIILWNANKNITKLSLTAKTSAVYNMLQDLDDTYKSDYELLGLGEFVEKLRESNTKIEKLMNDRFDESAEKITISVKSARDKTDGYFDDIINRVSAYINIEGLAKYNDFVNRINVVVAKYSKAKMSKQSAKDEQDEDDKTTPTTPPSLSERYPDAREWSKSIRVMEAVDGEVFYCIWEGRTRYFKLINHFGVPEEPYGPEAAGIWEELF